MIRLFVILWVFLATGSGLCAQKLSFQEEDPSKLVAMVVRIENGFKGMPSSVAVLRVSNPTAFWAEPVEFRISNKLRGKKRKAHKIARVLAPYGSRNGRAIAPGESLVYMVNVPIDAKEVDRKGVKVTQASFFEGTPVLEGPVTVGQISDAETLADLLGNRIRFNSIAPTNNINATVDVMLLAKFKSPKAGECLIQCRLKPKEAKQWTVEGPMVQAPGVVFPRGSVLSSVELVDWSVLQPASHSKHTKVLKMAYESMYSWPEQDLVFTARYRVVKEAYDWTRNKRIKIVEVGRAECTGDRVQFVPDKSVSQMRKVGCY